MRLRCIVSRGPKGLGLAVNQRNLVIEITPGGQADADGLLAVGDVVLAVDGVLLEKPMAQVMRHGAKSYELLVQRNCPEFEVSIDRTLPTSPLREAATHGVLKLLNLTVVRDENGLGLDMSGFNVLKAVVPGGSAERCGGWEAGDMVVAVNGIKLAGRRLVDVLPRGHSQYTFSVLRVAELKASLPSVGPINAVNSGTVNEKDSMTLAKLGDQNASKPLVSIETVPQRVVVPGAPRGGSEFFRPSAAMSHETDTLAAEEVGSSGSGLLGMLIGNWGLQTQQLPICVQGVEYVLGRTLPAVREGVVHFEAKRCADREIVCIKRTVATGLERKWALREGANWASISPIDAKPHENILRFFGQQVLTDGYIYTVSELCHDQNLSFEYEARLNMGAFGEDEVSMIAADICGGLEYLHVQTPAITYRALSMDTVLLGTDGHWKLSDFRLCTTRSKVLVSKEDVDLEREEVAMIEKANRAPELDNLFSREHIGPKVDIWSVGCILYQLLFKKHPFRKAAIITDNWKIPSGRTTDEPLIALMSECLQLLPSDRPTAASLVRCFDAVADKEPVPAREYDYGSGDQGSTGVRELSTQVNSQKAYNASTSPGVYLRFVICRGPQGLGFALGPQNRVAAIVPGGQAENDGLLEVGDEVLVVDGIPLDGQPLSKVLSSGATTYEFIVYRNDPQLQASIERLPSDSPIRAAEKGQLSYLKLSIARDANGLGLDMSGTNVLKKLIPGGAAERSGGWRAGDVITGVNGVKLNGSRLVGTLPKGLPEYTFSVLRLTDYKNSAFVPKTRTENPNADGKPTSSPITDTSNNHPPPKPSEDVNMDERSSETNNAPSKQGSGNKEPTDTELLEFILMREGRSRAGLLALYAAWQEEEAMRHAYLSSDSKFQRQATEILKVRETEAMKESWESAHNEPIDAKGRETDISSTLTTPGAAGGRDMDHLHQLTDAQTHRENCKLEIGEAREAVSTPLQNEVSTDSSDKHEDVMQASTENDEAAREENLLPMKSI